MQTQTQKKKEEAEVKNEADNLIYSSEKLINQDLKDKLKPEQSEKIKKSIEELKNAITSNDMNKIKDKVKETKDILAEVSN